MAQIIIEYVLIVLLVTGIGYFVYLLKDTEIYSRDDYFGLDYVILGSLAPKECTPENVKKIIRHVSQAVQFVEINYKCSENTFKEEEAIKIAMNSISLLNFEGNIDSESLRYLVRSAAALLPPTNTSQENTLTC